MRSRFLGTAIGVLVLPFCYAACGSDGDPETVNHSGPADHGDPRGSGGEVGEGGASGASGNGAGAISGNGGVGGASGAAGISGAAGVSGSNGSGGTSAMDGSAGGGTGGAAPVIPERKGECPAFENGTVSVGTLSGILIVAGAKPATPTAPLVFYWHGTASTSDEFLSRAPALQDRVVAEGGVLVSFQGTLGGDLLSGTSIFGEADLPVVDQIVACAVQNHNVDPRRIFTTGCSAGGMFAAALAARRSGYIAAAATNGGGWVMPVTWQDDHTPPLMTIHGPPGYDANIIDLANTSAIADQAFKARGGFVIDCSHTGGHCIGPPFDDAVWTFFEAHPYGVEPEPWSSLPAGFESTCKIFEGTVSPEAGL